VTSHHYELQFGLLSVVEQWYSEQIDVSEGHGLDVALRPSHYG
jgi:hypothetical protein